MIAGDHIALFIHAQAAVSIAIVGKTHIEMILDHELLQALNVGRTGVQVDIQAVGLCVDDVGVSPQGIEHTLGNVPGAAVGTV